MEKNCVSHCFGEGCVDLRAIIEYSIYVDRFSDRGRI